MLRQAFCCAQDKQGNTALHLAARAGHAALVQALLQPGASWSAPAAALAGARNKLGQVPLHCAALAGCQQSTQALQNANPAAVGASDKRGRTPAELATKRGFAVGPCPFTLPSTTVTQSDCRWTQLPLAMCQSWPAFQTSPWHAASSRDCTTCHYRVDDISPFVGHWDRHESAGLKQCIIVHVWSHSLDGEQDLVGKVPGTVGDVRTGASVALQQPAQGAQTVIIAPGRCHEHRTCPEPITRQAADPPPENVRRLRVLTDPGTSAGPAQYSPCCLPLQLAARGCDRQQWLERGALLLSLLQQAVIIKPLAAASAGAIVKQSGAACSPSKHQLEWVDTRAGCRTAEWKRIHAIVSSLMPTCGAASAAPRLKSYGGHAWLSQQHALPPVVILFILFSVFRCWLFL